MNHAAHDEPELLRRIDALQARVAELEREKRERQRAEAMLRESEERFRQLAENVPGVIYLCLDDARYTMLYLNDEVERLTGYPKQQFLDDDISFTDLYHPDDAARIAPIVNAAIAKRQPFKLQYRLRHRDGGWRWVNEVGAGVFRDNELVMLEGYLTDVTEQVEADRALRQRERWLRLVADQLPAVLWTTDRELRFTGSFGAGLEALGLAPAEVVGRTLTQYFGTDDPSFPTLKAHRRALAGESVTYEQQWEQRTFATQVEPLRDESGEIVGALGMAIDVTDQKHAERIRFEADTRFAKAFHASPMSMTISRLEDGEMIDANEAFSRMSGWSRNEVVGRNSVKMGLWRDPELRESMVEQLRRTGSVREMEGRFFNKAGQERIGVVAAEVIELGGQPHLLAIAQDVTERRTAEQALRQSEQRYAALAAMSPVGIFQTDAQGRCLYVNERWSQMTGLSQDQAASDGWAQAIHPDDRQEVFDAWQTSTAHGEPFRMEFRMARPDSSIMWVFSQGTPQFDADGKVTGYVGAVTDISERKRVEQMLRNLNAELEQRVRNRTAELESANDSLRREAAERGRAQQALAETMVKLRESEASYRSLITNLPGVIYRCELDSDWTMRFISEQVERMTGYEASQLIANSACSFASLIHEDDRPGVEQTVRDAVQNGRSFDLEYRIRHRNGSTRWMYEKGQGVFDDDGRLLHLEGAIFDITDRKRVEQDLDRFFELSPEMLCIAGFDGYFKRINPAYERTLGYSIHELSQRPFVEFVHVDDREPTLTQMGRLTEGQLVRSFENRYIARDGQVRWLNWHALPIMDEGLIYATARDITSDKQAEQRLEKLQSELAHVSRLTTMGELATSLAHEVNQPLYAVCNYVQGCILRLEGGRIDQDELVQTLHRVAREAERAGGIIKHMRDFLRKRPPDPRPADINTVLAELNVLIEPDARRHKVAIVYDLHPDLPTVRIDRIQIEQVIVNLVRNAVEAMAEAQSPQRRVTLATRREDDGAVRVSVRDTGPGVSEEAAQRLFGAFFTTKAQGMGMGLSISRTIIESHHGRLDYFPADEGGADFQFRLPACDDEPAIGE